MQRIDGPTVSAQPLAPRATGTGTSAPGHFTRGDPIAGVPPTTLDADWAEAVQEELCGVIEHAGIALDKANRGQLLAAILQIANGSGTSGSNANGSWEKRSSGIVEQWGIVSGSFGEGSQAITFPIPFPNACENVQFTAINASGDHTHDIWAEAQTWSTTGGSVFLNFVNAQGVAACDGFFWTAKGR